MRRLVAALLAPLAVASVAPKVSGASLLGEPPREVVFRLDRPQGRSVDLLLPFRDASVERLGPMKLYLSSRWGRWHEEPWWRLSWGALAEPEPTPTSAPVELDLDVQLDPGLGAPDAELPPFEALLDRRSLEARLLGLPLPSFDTTGPSLVTNGFGAIFRLPPVKPVVDWRCRRSPVLVLRPDGEGERFDLVRCDGSTAPEALDKLSILARPPEATRPGDLLPDEPDLGAWSARREWAAGVRVVHPRLLWVLQHLADAFPRRSIVVYSGYRPLAEVNDGSGHKSLHGEGRALDIAVHRVPNDKVFLACRELKDVGCGYYPHNKFVHVDVRRAHSGKAFWIDASQAGEPAKYVDAWPGVIEEGGLACLGEKSPAPSR